MKEEKQREIWRKASKKYYHKNKEKLIPEMIKRNNKSYKGEKQKKACIQAKARYYVEIPKGQICQFKGCRKLAKVRHHEDYDNPLVVKFYCEEHHAFIHRK